MSMQQNTIGRRHRGRTSKDNRASARERWSASLCMPVWPSCPRGPDPRYCVSDVQHLMGESATNRIDALPQRFRLFVGSLAHGSATAAMQLQQRMTAQPLLMKVPSRSSRAACCSSACVFITIGPYQATGSRSGFPETSRNRIPSSPAWTVTSSPLSKRTSERLPALADQDFAAIDLLFGQDTEGPPQCAFGSRGVRQLFPTTRRCCAAYGRSDKGQIQTSSTYGLWGRPAGVGQGEPDNSRRPTSKSARCPRRRRRPKLGLLSGRPRRPSKPRARSSTLSNGWSKWEQATKAEGSPKATCNKAACT